ncbi:hypothetical protein ACP275_07G066100 [Erythranthe tilingii]
MASQGHPNNTFNAGQDMNQAQMTRNEPSDVHSQGQATNFFQETGTNVKNMAHSAVNIAEGAVTGAANVAHGAADVLKNTLGMNSSGGTTTTNHSGGTTNCPSSTNHPSNPS